MRGMCESAGACEWQRHGPRVNIFLHFRCVSRGIKETSDFFSISEFFHTVFLSFFYSFFFFHFLYLDFIFLSVVLFVIFSLGEVTAGLYCARVARSSVGRSVMHVWERRDFSCGWEETEKKKKKKNEEK